nr:uncharacterized protein LOC129385823 [Dermacentor andersoni]
MRKLVLALSETAWFRRFTVTSRVCYRHPPSYKFTVLFLQLSFSKASLSPQKPFFLKRKFVSPRSINCFSASRATALAVADNLNEKTNSLPQASPLLRVKRTVGCIDHTTANGNLCYNAQCPFFSMGACKDGLCACAPKGTNMAALREVCYSSCYTSCTHRCFVDDAMKESVRSPCDNECTKLCYEN